jgi:hypothetical protein
LSRVNENFLGNPPQRSTDWGGFDEPRPRSYD